MAIINTAVGNSIGLVVDDVVNAARTILYDAAGNKAVATEFSQPAILAGVPAMAVNDMMALPIRADRMGSVALASNNPLLIESFEGATVHAGRWLVVSTTMVAAMTTVSGLVINSGSITTITTGYMLTSAKRFLKSMRAPLQCKFRARMAPINNAVMEIGFGDASTFNGAHTTGAFWQATAAGAIIPVVMYNGLVLTGTDIRSLVSNANYYTWDIISDDDEVVFVVQDTSTSTVISRQSIHLGVAAQRILSTSQIPAFMRVYNTGTAPATAAQMIVTDFNVLNLDIVQNKQWPHLAATLNRSVIENPFTGAQTAAWANSAEPASAALSNTAAGYATLGGKFQFAAVAGAVTDFALFGFQVPVPSNFVITGVDIEAWNTGAAVATTPTVLTWALGVGATAVSLAGVLTRVGLGAQDFAIGAAVGARAVRLSKTFTTPLFCPSGRFIHIILRMPVGTATASQVVAGMVNIEGYSE